MSERSLKRDVIDVTVFGASILGGVLSSVFLSEAMETGYDAERAAEIPAQIDTIDEKAIELLEGNECHVSIYGFMRSTNELPQDHTKISEALNRTCSEVSDDKARLIGSYVSDISVLNAEQAEQEDLRFVSGAERLAFGIVTFGFLNSVAKAAAWASRRRQ